MNINKINKMEKGNNNHSKELVKNITYCPQKKPPTRTS